MTLLSILYMRGSRKFCQKGPNSENFYHLITILVDEGREDPDNNKSGPLSGPPPKRHLNGVSLAGP